MNSQDLQIGNWIWEKARRMPVQVSLEILSAIQVSNILKNEDKLPWKPIRLTIPILSQFGFKYLGLDNYSIHRYQKENFHLERVWRSKTYLWVGVEGGDIHIEYLHQLQNAYKLVTGKKPVPKRS